MAVTTLPKISFSRSDWLSRSKRISRKPFLRSFGRIYGFLVKLQTNLIIKRVSCEFTPLSIGSLRQFLIVEISGSLTKCL